MIRIGRSTDNHVILYSAVVSRHHVELRQVGNSWEIVNLGTNGTYLDGKRITKVPVIDGAIIRLARSGPNIQIRLGAEALKELPEHLTSDAHSAQRVDHNATVTEVTDAFRGNEDPKSTEVRDSQAGGAANASRPGTIPVPPHLRLSSDEAAHQGATTGIPESTSTSGFGDGAESPGLSSGLFPRRSASTNSGIRRLNAQPTTQEQVLQTIGGYKVLNVVGQGDIGITYLAERDGQRLILKSLNANWLSHPKARAALEVEAETLSQLDHPHIPEFVDFFLHDGRPYLVIERIEGESIAHQVSSSGQFTLEQAIAIMLKLCEIMAYLHQFVPPVFHRNIEPMNLIRHQDSEDIALIGFGAVKALVLERKGWVGSNGYADPDQLSIAASAQVDLYAIAPTLAYMLTGKNPVTFCQKTPNHPYQFNADAVSGVPTEVRMVLKKLTHPNAEMHYPSVDAVSDALRSLL
ncbi:MAG: FHA domain-containing serine/threonine-protein kinase [Elainellaceae cyanobacterium]